MKYLKLSSDILITIKRMLVAIDFCMFTSCIYFWKKVDTHCTITVGFFSEKWRTRLSALCNTVLDLLLERILIFLLTYLCGEKSITIPSLFVDISKEKICNYAIFVWWKQMWKRYLLKPALQQTTLPAPHVSSWLISTCLYYRHWAKTPNITALDCLDMHQ